MTMIYKIQFPKLREIWRDATLSPSAKVILLDLLLYAGVDDKTFPSEATLADNHDYSVRHIRNLLTELETRKLIEKYRSGFGKPNHYFFNQELYCLIDTGKSASDILGNIFPQSTGSPVPSNIVSNKYSQSNNSQQKDIKGEYIFPCKLNGCEDGWITNKTTNTVRKCECRIQYEQGGGTL